ncbi:hypothetical protein PBAL39_07665 [Pedobacter sp. BAL39]|uniref:hypothetical protein n=1 Tax=Pedobacter sp. BAL39 TaxID=391596 RepID=UPI0001559F69|nr:hypothetical protein [Pedobacter sp. BAL39]EDM35547.1 hypothetical protein PBAL39_07665 [Pedobacter sp. BAL39]
MASKEIAKQAKDFLYELNTARHEYSFSSGDQWTLSQSTAKEKTALEAAFYPVFFTTSNPAELADLTQLIQEKTGSVSATEQSTENSKDRIYLVAHCETKLK